MLLKGFRVVPALRLHLYVNGFMLGRYSSYVQVSIKTLKRLNQQMRHFRRQTPPWITRTWTNNVQMKSRMRTYMVTPHKSHRQHYSPPPAQSSPPKRNHETLALHFTALSDQLFGIHHTILSFSSFNIMTGSRNSWDSGTAVAEDELTQLEGLGVEFWLGPTIKIKENIAFKYTESSYSTTTPQSIWA